MRNSNVDTERNVDDWWHAYSKEIDSDLSEDMRKVVKDCPEGVNAIRATIPFSCILHEPLQESIKLVYVLFVHTLNIYQIYIYLLELEIPIFFYFSR